MDLRVFDQDTFWCDVTGRPHRIRDMTPDYRVNVLNFLAVFASYFHLMTMRRLIEVCASPDPPAVERLRAVATLDAQSWLERTPLVVALRSANRRSDRGRGADASGNDDPPT